MPDPDEEPDLPSSNGPLDEEFEVCAYCGAILPKGEWCPMITDTDARGQFVVRSFCNEACKEAWSNDGSAKNT